MSEIARPTIAEARALAELRAHVRAGNRERIYIDYVYDSRHMWRVREALRREGVTLRFGSQPNGIWARIVSGPV